MFFNRELLLPVVLPTLLLAIDTEECQLKRLSLYFTAFSLFLIAVIVILEVLETEMFDLLPSIL